MATLTEITSHPKFKYKKRPIPTEVFTCVHCGGQHYWLSTTRDVYCCGCGRRQVNLRLMILVKP